MTLDAVRALIAAILADLPAAITTGADLIRLINETWPRLPPGGATPDDIRSLLQQIHQQSEQIQQTPAD